WVDRLVEEHSDAADHAADLTSRVGRDDPGAVHVEEGPGRVQPAAGRHAALQAGDIIDRVEYLVDHLAVRPVRVQPADQGDHSGYLRGGHRRPAVRPVLAVRQRAQNVHAGGGQIHGRRPVVREEGELVVRVCRGDRDDVVRVKSGREVAGQVVVARIVAGCGDEDVADVRGVSNGLLVQRVGRVGRGTRVAGRRSVVRHSD